MKASVSVLLVVLGIVVVALAIARVPRHASGGGARPGEPADATRTSVPRVTLPGSQRQVRPLAPVGAVPGTAAPPSAGGDGPSAIGAYLAALEELDERQPGAFHRLAGEHLVAFMAAERGGSPERRDAQVDELLALLDERPLTERVRGGLLALLGAWGREDELLGHGVLAGEAWRSALIGSAWAEGRGDTPIGLRLEPVAYLSRLPRGELSLLALPLARRPGPRLAATLLGLITEPAESTEALLTRETMVFVLGVGVDADAEVRELFRQLLLDPSPAAVQLRHALCWVLAQAESEAARGLLVTFLGDPQLGPEGRQWARRWLGQHPGGPGEIEALAAPLFDRAAGTEDRMTAIGGLLGRVESGSRADHRAIEEILSLALADETERTTRLAAVSTLAITRGGRTKLTALERVLREDEVAGCRRWAAWGLGTLGPPFRAEAQGLLRAALGRETDPVVRGQIEELLAPGG